MRTQNNKVYILGSARIPFAKSQTAYSKTTRKELMSASLNALVDKYRLDGVLVGDTALGAVMNSSSNFNLARECVLDTKLDPNTPGYNVQRACGTGLETVWQIGLKVNVGAIDIGIAGGVDTNSDLPIEVTRQLQLGLLDLHKAKTFSEKLQAISTLRPGSFKPVIPNVNEPRTLLSMGDHCELMAKEWQIPRQEQDAFALKGHLNGTKAYENRFYDDLVFPFNGLNKDSLLRGDTSLEKLAKLKPAFDPKNGSLTAGNSSPLTDGSACVLVGSAKGAEKLNLTPLAKLIDVQVAAVDFLHSIGLLMAPTKAVSELLQRNNLTFNDFDYFEIHEAFAAQVLCNLKAWESQEYCQKVLGLKGALGSIDKEKLNTVGSSIALGHPFAATGSRIVGTLAKLLSKGGKKRGLISICTAGGMGIAAILEST